MGNINKKNVLYTNENSIDNNKLFNKKESIKRHYQNLNKKCEQLFYKKINKIMSKKGQMTTQNKSKQKFTNYSVNNSFANFHKKFGNKFYNFKINDKTFTTKGNNLSNLKDSSMNNSKSNKKHLNIECGYTYTNKNKYNISGDKYLKKKKAYISSLPCSTRKSINTNINTSTKKEKEVISISNKRTYVGVNSSLVSKYKNKIKPYIRASLYKNKQSNNAYKKISKKKGYTKRIIDNTNYNISIPNTGRRGENEPSSDKNSSNYKINSDLNSFDVEINKDSIKTNLKINTLRKERDRKKEKISIKNENKFKSIKVNKNNYLDKGSKSTITSINQNSNNSKNLNTNYNSNKSNNIINTKKSAKNKARLQSCKFTNEQIYQLEKKIISDNNNSNNNIKYIKKLSDKGNKKNSIWKNNQSSSTKERKNITYFSNYMKNNNLYNKNNVEHNHKHYYTNSNTSTYANNSAIIRNVNTNLNNADSKNLNTSNKKKAKLII